MSHIFFFIPKMYSACSLSFFNYPYISPNVQTKLLSILERPTHNLVLTKVSISIGLTTYFSHEVLYHMLVRTTRDFELFDKKRVVLFNHF